MDWLLFYVLAFAFLAPAVHCVTSFIRPPNFDRAVDEDTSNSIRYEEGSPITVIWETDLERVDLTYVQQLDNDYIDWKVLLENVTATRYTWSAEYNPVDFVKNDADAIGWFTLNPPGSSDAIRGSQRFNVTAPEPASTTGAASTTSTTTEPTIATSITADSTSTGPPSSEETSLEANPESSSGLSTGATAGIVVGALVGGLLVLGGIGFLIWKRYKRRSGGSNLPGEMDGSPGSNESAKPHDLHHDLPHGVPQGPPQEMSSDSTFRPELAAYPVRPQQVVRSQPGLHEAPG